VFIRRCGSAELDVGERRNEKPAGSVGDARGFGFTVLRELILGGSGVSSSLSMKMGTFFCGCPPVDPYDDFNSAGKFRSSAQRVAERSVTRLIEKPTASIVTIGGLAGHYYLNSLTLSYRTDILIIEKPPNFFTLFIYSDFAVEVKIFKVKHRTRKTMLK
jgi:hypothetical protein